MKAEITNVQGYLVIHFTGEVDLNAQPHSRDIILNCLSLRRNTVVDLSAVTYIDSSGIASFVESYQLAKKYHLEFGLTNISDAVTKVLHLAHLENVFPVYRSLSP